MKKILTSLAAGAVMFAGLTALVPTQAEAQQRLCTSRHSLINTLQNKYKEQRRGLGLASERGVMEVYVSKQGTWTVVMTLSNGQSCILAAGKHYEQVEPTAFLEGVES